METAGTAAVKLIVMALMIFIDIIIIMVPLLMTVVRKNKLQSYKIVTEAVVTEVNQGAMGIHGGHRGNPMWFPTFQYNVNGQAFTQYSSVGTNPPAYKVGDRVKILVDPNDHSKFIQAESPTFNLATKILWAIAAVFVLGTVLTGILL